MDGARQVVWTALLSVCTVLAAVALGGVAACVTLAVGMLLLFVSGIYEL